MRLCYVVHQFFPYCHSGTEQHCLAAAREARRRGDDVTILSLHWDHARAMPSIRLLEKPYDGFRVIRLDHWQRINPNDVLRDHDNRHLDGWFRAVLDDVRPEAVHFFHLRQLGSNLIDVARDFGARTVVSLTDFWWLCPRFTLLRSDGTLCDGPPGGGAGCVPCNHPELAGVVPAPAPAALADDPPSRLRALLDRLELQRSRYRRAHATFAPSRFLADMYVRNGFEPAPRVVPYGLERERVHPLPVERPRRPLRLAFCGVLSPWKAPRLAIEALAVVTSPVALCVHGRLEEPMFADYIDTLRRAAANEPRVTLAGAYDAARAPQVFADMDVLVVPSTWYENTPFVVLEAFAAGVPVLASDLGGLAEIVRHEQNGWLFRAGDAGALGQAIEALAADPERVRRARPAPPPDIATNYDAFAAAYRG